MMLFRTRADSERPGPPPRQFDVVFVLPHMGRGGAQRVTSIVANAWTRQGRRVCILTWDNQKTEAHELDPGIVRLDMPSFVRDIVQRAGVIRRSRVEVQHYLRQAERWMRPRWPWRKARRKPKAVKASLGGVERFFADRRPWWSSRGIRRLAATWTLRFDRRKRKPAFKAISSISRGSFSRLVLGYRVDDFREVLSEIRTPVIVSLLTKTNLYVLEAMRDTNIRIVISERNDPDLQEIDPGLAVLRQLAYRDAYAVTSNSKGVLAKLAAFVPEDKLKLLPNPIEAPPVTPGDEPRQNRFVTVARLVHQKGVDLLLDAFAEAADDLGGWTLDIVGDGPLLPELTARAAALGISERVTFHGYLSDPPRILRASRVFVLPSRFEGMPNALLEAMACGLAPIVTDASPGPLESVTHDESGIVVPTENVAAMAAAMRLLAADEQLVSRLAQGAVRYVREHDWSVVEPQWIHVLGISPVRRKHASPRSSSKKEQSSAKGVG